LKTEVAECLKRTPPHAKTAIYTGFAVTASHILVLHTFVASTGQKYPLGIWES